MFHGEESSNEYIKSVMNLIREHFFSINLILEDKLFDSGFVFRKATLSLI